MRLTSINPQNEGFLPFSWQEFSNVRLETLPMNCHLLSADCYRGGTWVENGVGFRQIIDRDTGP
jgi:hypothetical protein